MNFAIFTFLFLIIVNRLPIKSFIEGFSNKKEAKDIKDEKLLNFLKTKSSLNINKIKLLKTQTTWGMMGGLPAMPYMVISEDAYKNFSPDELQWLLLHEAGHYVLWHNVKIILVQVIFIALGYVIIFNSEGLEAIVVALLLGLIFAILYAQIARRFEYEANDYALSKMDNPKGLSNILEKAKTRWRNKGISKDNWRQKLFNIWILKIYEDLLEKSQTIRNKDL